MRAYQLQDDWSIDNLRRVERPDPSAGPGQVLIRLRAASLNFRDLFVLKRGYGASTGTLPLIPVSDGVGEVVALGEGVTRVALGDRVCPMFFPDWMGGAPRAALLAAILGGPRDGTMAELMAIDARSVSRVPAHLSDAEAATLPCAALTAWRALVSEGRVKAGDTVVVQGTGGVSLFALQFAKLLGACAIVTSSSDAKLERAKALGADALINYRRTPEWGAAARDLAGGEGVDHIIEVGGEQTLGQSLRAVRVGGTLSLIGVLSGGKMDVRLGPIVTRAVRLQGVTVGSREDFEAMARAIEQHRLRPVIDKVFPFDDLRPALDHLSSGAQFGKVCIRHDSR
jgi:NADPH:quinone reductase-like Zn-dependent oxidoreductase